MMPPVNETIYIGILFGRTGGERKRVPGFLDDVHVLFLFGQITLFQASFPVRYTRSEQGNAQEPAVPVCGNDRSR